MSTAETPQSIDVTDGRHGTADRRRQGALALHDVAGRVRGGAEPRDGLDRDLVPPRPYRGVRRDDRRRGGRSGWLRCLPDIRGIYGGAWQGPVFVLTHHPDDAQPANGVTFLSCDVAEAVRIGLEAADGKNLEVFSATIGRQLLERGLIDEIDLHIAPVLLGDGIRLFDNPGGAPV